MEQSIFNTELTTNSNNIIHSMARWSRFLGIVFIIVAALILIGGLGAFFYAGISQSEMLDALGSVPQYAWLANVPSYAIAIIIVITSILTGFVGYLYYALGKNGITYFNTQEEVAFEKTFQNAKQIFLLTSIVSSIGILITIMSMIAFL